MTDISRPALHRETLQSWTELPFTRSIPAINTKSRSRTTGSKLPTNHCECRNTFSATSLDLLLKGSKFGGEWWTNVWRCLQPDIMQHSNTDCFLYCWSTGLFSKTRKYLQPRWHLVLNAPSFSEDTEQALIVHRGFDNGLKPGLRQITNSNLSMLRYQPHVDLQSSIFCQHQLSLLYRF